jgi:predicted nucleic acid-binding protein
MLTPRASADLTWAKTVPLNGSPILLDTTVYIDLLHGRTPDEVDQLLVHRTCEHSSVCVSELTHAFGRLNPADSRTKSTLKSISGLIEQDIPPHRRRAPNLDAWIAAGMLSGLYCRLTGIQERRILNDSLVYLQALQQGCGFLTRNVRDFDLLEQLLPSGRAIFYEAV